MSFSKAAKRTLRVDLLEQNVFMLINEQTVKNGYLKKRKAFGVMGGVFQFAQREDDEERRLEVSDDIVSDDMYFIAGSSKRTYPNVSRAAFRSGNTTDKAHTVFACNTLK